MGNVNSVGYAPCYWYRNTIKDGVGISHIEDRADSLILSKLGEKRLKRFCQNNFGKTGINLKNRKRNECFTFIN